MASEAVVISGKYPRRALPGVQSDAAPITSVGSVVSGNIATPVSDAFPTVLTATLANATGGALTFVVFDAVGQVAATIGGTINNPTWSGSTDAALKSSIQTTPIVIKGMNMQITTGTSAQFSQTFKYWRVNMAGDSFGKNIPLSSYQRNTANNALLLTVSDEYVISPYAGFQVVVAANTTVAINFFVKEVMNTPVAG